MCDNRGFLSCHNCFFRTSGSNQTSYASHCPRGAPCDPHCRVCPCGCAAEPNKAVTSNNGSGDSRHPSRRHSCCFLGLGYSMNSTPRFYLILSFNCHFLELSESCAIVFDIPLAFQISFLFSLTWVSTPSHSGSSYCIYR